ncbi:YkgJ family cysteine cluster protein [Desulfovibrio inopinatus]|uniref:YkgJ family cysteine cluster protein n=1 Tax=Desulfovibrio inopinatus TaxID=102109 RepID=UPI0004036674|nr:YkgJ family cysteine cluster protein [Desulfovibrio inopinatus]
MALDFSKYFEAYEKLCSEVDAVFGRVKEQCGDGVTCTVKCSDCCHAVFDITLVEAVYLNYHLRSSIGSGEALSQLEELANRADRELFRLKRQAYKAQQRGMDDMEILETMGKERIRCPLLNDSDMCIAYAHRPITCRLYGIPMEIGGQSRTCGKSGFQPGGNYPTVKMDKVQERLLALSQALIDDLPTRFSHLSRSLAPVSQAILSRYDEEFFGLEDGDDDGQGPDSPASTKE